MQIYSLKIVTAWCVYVHVPDPEVKTTGYSYSTPTELFKLCEPYTPLRFFLCDLCGNEFYAFMSEKNQHNGISIILWLLNKIMEKLLIRLNSYDF